MMLMPGFDPMTSKRWTNEKQAQEAGLLLARLDRHVPGLAAYNRAISLDKPTTELFDSYQ
jgi:hypothetical protein